MLRRLAQTLLLCACALACALAAATVAGAQSGGSRDSAGPTGGASPTDPALRPPRRARIVNGRAIAPAEAPPEVVAVIEAANRIAGKPYRYGGGHANPEDSGYDCSGAVSYALRGGGFLAAALDSSGFMRWALPGRGRWITVYTNPGHAFLVVAGVRFDTGNRGRPLRGTAPGRGPRWARPRPTRGFTARHPAGF